MFFRSLSSTSLRHTALFFCKIFRHSRMPWRVDQEISSTIITSSPSVYCHYIYIYYIQFSNVLRIHSAAVFLHVDRCPHVRPRLPRQLGPCRLTHFPAFASEVNLGNLYFLSLFCSLFPTVHLFQDKGSSLHFSKWLKVVDSQGFSNSAIQTALKLRWVVSIALNSLHF